ncbi:MAG: hypothetical protein EPN97_16945 [Alphaproteobacteria bacterium]|nr:MAG: hypothetical protein EPN97_16945 [Alphaproteobacteria bacterium]
MTAYLWYSAEAAGEKRGSGASAAFQRNVRNSDLPYRVCLYLDSMGEPVMVSNVTQGPGNITGFKDIRIVDVVDKAVCLTSRDGGQLQPAGFEFCAAKGIEPDFFSILDYMRELDRTADYLRSRIEVHRPLKLKGLATP